MVTPRTPRHTPRRALASGASALILGIAPLGAAAPPRPVSPGATTSGARVEARCPTFSWAGVEDARGYELAVFRIPVAGGAEPELATRTTLPANAQTWTPPLGECLERGERYAWSVAAVTSPAAGELDWAPEHLFEVDAAPAGHEVQHALATLRRCLADGACARDLGAELAADPDETGPRIPPAAESRRREDRSDRRSAGARDEAATATATDAGIDPRDPHDPRGLTRASAAATTPTIGTPSLRLSANLALSPNSNVFKAGYVLLWEDGPEGNTALGRAALSSVTGNTVSNTAVGRYALQLTKSGGPTADADHNTGVGDQALRFNTTGSNNTAVGSTALLANTLGSHNTALGRDSLRQNTSGDRNTGVGSNSLFSNSSGDGNTAVGFFALLGNNTGSDNTAAGTDALRQNTSGHSNTATGSSALRYNTVGFENTAHGFEALRANTTGDRSAALGAGALQSNTTGNENTAAGFYTLGSNVGGIRNTALGAWALSNNETSSGNTAVGFQALLDNVSGSRNVAIGYQAGQDTTGSDNIMIFNNGIAGESHVLRIGQATADIGVGAIDQAFIHGIAGRAPGAGAATVQIGTNGQLGVQMSTRRVKQDIDDLDPTVADRLLDLRPVAFRYREHVAADSTTPFEFGLIAEEVAAVFPELVVYDEDGDPLTVKYHLLSSLLLGELQRLHGRVEALETRPPAGARRRGRP